MATATWPVSLPQNIPKNTVQSQKQDQTIESEFDLGPPQRRRRTTAIFTELNFAMILDTDVKLQTLFTFYDTELLGGVSLFDWEDPADAVAADREFQFLARPTYTWLTKPEVFSVNIALRMYPF